MQFFIVGAPSNIFSCQLSSPPRDIGFAYWCLCAWDQHKPLTMQFITQWGALRHHASILICSGYRHWHSCSQLSHWFVPYWSGGSLIGNTSFWEQLRFYIWYSIFLFLSWGRVNTDIGSDNFMEPNLGKMTCSGEWGNSLKKRLGRKVEKPRAPKGRAVE